MSDPTRRSVVPTPVSVYTLSPRLRATRTTRLPVPRPRHPRHELRPHPHRPDAKSILSTAFAGQTVGFREVDDQSWLVNLLNYDLGYFDNERGRVEPGPNPFTPDKVLTMCPEQGVNHVTG